MMTDVTTLLEGFWSYQTPVSFMAGIGVYHVYCKLTHHDIYNEEDDHVQEA